MTNIKVVEELKRLADKNTGLLLPEHVVDAAKSKSSVLHDKFNWDDSDAAHQFRLQQARQLINCCVEYTGGGDEVEQQVFVSLKADRITGGYRGFVQVMNNKNMRSQLLAEALDDMRRFEEKYETLKELSSVFSAMKKVSKGASVKVH